MPLTITYIHSHECSRKGQHLKTYPASDNGTAMIIEPVCEETMSQLEQIEVEKY